MTPTERVDLFEAERARLKRLAYRYLGTVSDTDDVVQEAWLRFSGAQEVRDPKAFLSKVVTRLCLDRLKSAAYRHEEYVGEWLPEPFVETEDTSAALDISYAVMRSLEALTPEERAAFFLHDIFETPFDDIAETLKRTPATCRKLAERARTRLAGDTKRFAPKQADIAKFLNALELAISENEEPLRQLLSDQVQFISDGGGKTQAARNIIRGDDFVARFLIGLVQKGTQRGQFAVKTVTINDAPGMLVTLDGKLEVALAFDLDEAGQIGTFYAISNPDKLMHLSD